MPRAPFKLGIKNHFRWLIAGKGGSTFFARRLVSRLRAHGVLLLSCRRAACVFICLVLLAAARANGESVGTGQETANPEVHPGVVDSSDMPAPAFGEQLQETAVRVAPAWLRPEGIGAALQTMLLLGVVSLVPAVLLMTTSFVRLAVVLGLLRQALGTQMLPSNQIVTALAMFLTLLVMSPVWLQVYEQAVVPYTAKDSSLSAYEAWQAGIRPVRQFMSAQIEAAGNSDDVWLFYDYLPPGGPEPTSYDDVPLPVLLPAFMMSELKTAFLIGFQIYLPFLVLDLVVSSVTAAMGMVMLPPVMVSLPLKLLLFVLVDGWHLVVGMLLESFAPMA